MTSKTKIFVNYGPVFDISYHGDFKNENER